MFIFIKIVISNNDLKSFKFYITEKEHDTNENIHRLQDEIDALKRGKKETSANILK